MSNPAVLWSPPLSSTGSRTVYASPVPEYGTPQLVEHAEMTLSESGSHNTVFSKHHPTTESVLHANDAGSLPESMVGSEASYYSSEDALIDEMINQEPFVNTELISTSSEDEDYQYVDEEDSKEEDEDDGDDDDRSAGDEGNESASSSSKEF